MSVKLTEVSFSVAVGAEGHVNVTQVVTTLIPTVKKEQIFIDKRVYEDNDAIIYDDNTAKNEDGDIVLKYNNRGNKDARPLEITAVIQQ